MLLWLMTVYGLTLIITSSQIFCSLRDVVLAKTGSHFLQCPMCIGFWAGVGVTLAGLPLFSRLGIREVFASGLVGSGFCWIVHVTLVRLGQNKLLGIEDVQEDKTE